MLKPTNASNEKTESDREKSRISAPSITLPKGGGAIRGIGEKFAANPVTGTGSMNVPIFTSPGRSGFVPQLSLSYDSGSGNGPFGFGWSLSLPSITRKTDKGLPRYFDAQESDVFILSGAEDLVPVLIKDGNNWVEEKLDPRIVDGKSYIVKRYRPRIEGLFARIERWTNQSDRTDTFWRSISKDNITTWYGKTDNSRISDPKDKSRIFSWLICESYDDKGNAIVYTFAEENSEGVNTIQANERNRVRTSNRYLKCIKYGNRKPNRSAATWEATDPTQLPKDTWMFEVVFDYGEGHYSEQKAPDANHHDYAFAKIEPPANSAWPVRNDPFSSYRSGFEVRTYRLCRRVLMFHHFTKELDGIDDYLVRSTEFTYEQSPFASFVTSVTQSGYRYDKDKGKYLKKSLPFLEFEYSKAEINEEVREVDSESIENLPVGLDGSMYQWIDLDGEGIPGILTEQAGAWYYKRNTSANNIVKGNDTEHTEPRFVAAEIVALKPNAALSAGAQFMDLAGDGQLDLVELEGTVSGFYERTDDRNWEPFKAFVSTPNITWKDPNLKFIDLTGDGHADIMITEDQVFTWYPSRAEEGFGSAEKVCQAMDEERGPRLVFADGTQSIYLADLSGDGLTDIARIRNGEVCYWPNLGHGKFGPKVTMDNSPWFDKPDQFDQKRIRLADIDGSGTTDIIYLEYDRVAVYRNECGNSWSDPEYLTNFPQSDNLSSVMAVDLLGNGTACLVWSSPLPGNNRSPMRYIDLMGGQKPHLLINTINNLGAETHVEYAPSTKFYLDDKQNGTPWITRLPFPVHVVERVVTYDCISRNRFVTRYAYHHGYFDGVEREFRGFGMVEQWDTEKFGFFEDKGLVEDADNIEKESHVPPVLTRTWFHAGCFIDRDMISCHMAHEYFGAPKPDTPEFDAYLKTLLDDTVLIENSTPDEDREACRALKGSMLRQETYALDGSDKEKKPYAVTEQNFTISRLQPKAGNRHAVFFTHARETLSFHYERNPAVPRVQHALTLEVDDFGNVLKAVAIGYGRRQGKSTLQGDDKKKQEQTLITYTENDFTNAIDKPVNDPEYDPDSYRTPLPCETRTYELTGLTPENGAQRFSFDELTKDNFDKVLNLTEVPYQQAVDYSAKRKRLIEHVRTLYLKNDLSGPSALGQVESLALPYESFKLAFTSDLLTLIYGGKVNENVLKTEGKYLKSAEYKTLGLFPTSDSDNLWWIPSGRQTFDGLHFYLPIEVTDPFDNTTTIAYDNYHLLLTQTEDPLHNVIEAKNDYRALQPALITDPNRNRSAVRFDELDLVIATAVMGKENETDPEKIGDTLDDPTTRLEYDLFNWMNNGKPNYVHTFAREKHRDPSTRWQESYSYSDGFGREIQKKIQAEPGKVDVEDDDGNISTVDTTPNIRWVGSGWTIFNNKGKPVRQFEPFFSIDHHFQFGKKVGVSPILFYDPLERMVATLHPNHTYEKVVFDPWEQISYDVNDTVSANDKETGDPRTDAVIKGYVDEYFKTQPTAWQTWYQERIGGAKGPAEKDAAQKAAKHTDTPSVAHFDSLGRVFLTIAHNRFELKKPDGTIEKVDEKYPTRIVFDIEGNQREVIDAKGRVVMRYDYHIAGPEEGKEDEAGHRIYQNSMDAGERWMLPDVMGKPIRTWDSRGHQFKIEYDKLRRPLRHFVRGTNVAHSDPQTLNRDVIFEKIEYGEGLANDTTLNLRTRVYKSYDGAGFVTNEEFDFKGNLLRSSRNLTDDYKKLYDWGADPVQANWESFTSSTSYDALNRPIQVVAPHAGNDIGVIQPTYNEANLLERVDVWLKHHGLPVMLLDPNTADLHAVKDIDYNAKGQRELIEYGNNVKTTYEYDSLTFRLTHMFTQRGAGFPQVCVDELNDIERQQRNCPKKPPQCEGVQNLRYTYNPAGKITYILNNARQTIYFRNKCVEPSNDYIYDAIYRLIGATGREHLGQAGGAPVPASPNDSPRVNLDHPNDGNAMGRYEEEYKYDEVGNILFVRHRGSDPMHPGWKRCYQYAQNSNRLLSTGDPDAPHNPGSKCPIYYEDMPINTEKYSYDKHGNMISMPHLRQMIWDFEDQLQQVDLGGGGKAFYVYDAGGQRVRKVWEKAPGLMEERIYLGVFEIFRQRNGAGTVMLERETLHIMDDKQRIALVETRTIGKDDSPQQLIRYQFGNHLGSASLELDNQARIISYEEYYPYGSTSYQAVDKEIKAAAKRYRYTGKERDEESGLYYHGARYYAPWLGRWVCTDPSGLRDGVNIYEYTQSSPICFKDPTGTQRIPLDYSYAISHQPSLEERAADADSEMRSWMTRCQGKACAPPAGWSFVRTGKKIVATYNLTSEKTEVSGLPHLRLVYGEHSSSLEKLVLSDSIPSIKYKWKQVGLLIGGGLETSEPGLVSEDPVAYSLGARAVAKLGVAALRKAAGTVARAFAAGRAMTRKDIGFQFGARATREIGYEASARPGSVPNRSVTLQDLERIGEQVWKSAPTLRELASIKNLRGDVLMERFAAILRDWHRRSGFGIEIVNRLPGSSGGASILTRPFYLQIEAQVLKNHRTLKDLTEITHDLSVYYASRYAGAIGGKIPSVGQTGFSLIKYLESRIFR